jgi:hypothetical protein
MKSGYPELYDTDGIKFCKEDSHYLEASMFGHSIVEVPNLEVLSLWKQFLKRSARGTNVVAGKVKFHLPVYPVLRKAFSERHVLRDPSGCLQTRVHLVIR